MRIQLKLFANLSAYLPPDARHNTAEVEVSPGTTPHQVMDLYRIPRAQAHLVMVNGVFVAPDRRDARSLNEGDTLALWPPVAGG